jgi:hypothetical protein
MAKWHTIPARNDITYDLEQFLEAQGYDLEQDEIATSLHNLRSALWNADGELADKLETEGPFLSEWCFQREQEHQKNCEWIEEKFSFLKESA